MEILIHTIVKTIGIFALFGIMALLVKLASGMLPNKYRDGKIAPKITEQIEPDHVTDLNKEMEEAGVDNLRDLEHYRESGNLK